MIIDSWEMMAREGRSLQADMPSLKHFFPCNNSTTKLVDTQGDVIYDPSAKSFAGNSNRWNYDSDLQAMQMELVVESSTTPLESGQWAEFTDGKAILITWVTTTSSWFTAGTSNTRLHMGFTGLTKGPTGEAQGIQFAQDLHWSVGDASTNADDSILFESAGLGEEQSNDIPIVYYWAYEPTSATYLACKTANTRTDPGEYSPSGTFADHIDGAQFNENQTFTGGFNPSSHFLMDGISLQGLSYHVFSGTTLPSDWFESVNWEAQNWAAGNRVPYPGAVNWV